LLAVVVAFGAIRTANVISRWSVALLTILKVLRQLSRVVTAFGVGQALRARDLLMLLPGPSDLPLLRVAVDARPSEEAKAAFAARYPSATTLPEPTNLNRDYGRRSVNAAPHVESTWPLRRSGTAPLRNACAPPSRPQRDDFRPQLADHLSCCLHHEILCTALSRKALWRTLMGGAGRTV
jgi:hypothetical protein